MLSGNLELFALADVLRFVARSGATGAVNIYRPVEGGRILLSEGEVVGASVDTFEPSDADGVVESGLRLMEGGGGDFALEGSNRHALGIECYADIMDLRA